jgi:DNA-binding CsgD family transcriptional regulator
MQPLREIQSIWSKMLTGIDHTHPQPFANLDLHNLNHIFNVGDNYYFIFNMRLADIEFVSPEISKVLGCRQTAFTVPFVLANIHPEDLSWFLDFEQAATQFFQSLPKEKVPKYKIRYDYRMKNVDGSYVRLLQQSVAIEMAPAGEILRSFGVHTDITHIKKEGKPILSFIGLEGEASYFDVKVKTKFSQSEDLFTKREKEILTQLVNGKSSIQIANSLFLSKNTVDTHRRNIIKKAGVKKNTELISMVIRKGLI